MVRLAGISAFVLLFAGTTMATPSNDAADIELQKAFQEAMDVAVAEMMAPGPRQEGWDKGGIDLFQLVDSAPGGARQNYLLTIDKDGEKNVTIIRAGQLGPFVPKNWKAVLHAGDSLGPEPQDDLSFGAIDGPFYLAGWDNKRRVNDAFCSTGKMGGHLYEGPAGKEGEVPASLVPLLFNAMVKRLQDKTLCWRFDRAGDGYRTSYFLEDGRSLPALNAYEEKVVIVRAAPIEELLAAEPTAKAAE